jgi:hypothetical protein
MTKEEIKIDDVILFYSKEHNRKLTGTVVDFEFGSNDPIVSHNSYGGWYFECKNNAKISPHEKNIFLVNGEPFKCTKQAPKKKRGPKPKLNKREKLEARLSQVEETTKKAFTCEHNGKKLGSYDGHYWLCSESGPEETVLFAKWILDLEGK